MKTFLALCKAAKYRKRTKEKYRHCVVMLLNYYLTGKACLVEYNTVNGKTEPSKVIEPLKVIVI